ncbi:MAG: queuosine salvage family protein [Thermomicrobiales bacterium]|nr:queuosine salvage family protein [Thermomicrobiales bacterium]
MAPVFGVEDVNDDPLGVLTSTLPVVEGAAWVAIDPERVEATATELAAIPADPTPWAHPLHFTDPNDPERTAAWVFALDALNFCFWSENPEPAERWRVAWGGETVDGYWALAAALSRAMEEGYPLDDPAWLAACTPLDLRQIFRPAEPGGAQIPLFSNRLANVQELGRGLLEIGGGRSAAANLIRACNGSALELVARVATTLPSFDDIAWYRGESVRFYKRAQILAADLAGALEEHALGRFTDLDRLTAFADYKVPQVLRRFGILQYDPDLADRIARRELIPPGSPEEIEIRAATVWGVEELRRALARFGREQSASEIDWLLWQAGQNLPADTEPYHRTLTVFY